MPARAYLLSVELKLVLHASFYILLMLQIKAQLLNLLSLQLRALITGQQLLLVLAACSSSCFQALMQGFPFMCPRLPCPVDFLT